MLPAAINHHTALDGDLFYFSFDYSLYFKGKLKECIKLALNDHSYFLHDCSGSPGCHDDGNHNIFLFLYCRGFAGALEY